MKKLVIDILAVLVILALAAFGYLQFKRDHTFTLSAPISEEIQPVFGTVRVYGTQDTDVLFIDVENTENQYQIGYITPGMSETIKLEKGKWYKVQGAGDITIQMVNVRIQGAEESDKVSVESITENITENNLALVCDALRSGGISNVDVFEQWVKDGLKGNSDNSDVSGFSDADCRMTVMLLAGDSIHYDSVKENYDGTYLMFDVEAIDNQEAYRILKEKRNLFTTLFGEMPVSANSFADSFPDNIKKYGIEFKGEGFSVISILFKAYGEELAFVGHTGILVDCRNNDKVDANYMFVEKIAFGDPYTVTLVNDESELIEVLSQRADYSVEEGEPAPVVYKDAEIIGELRYESN